MFSQAEQREVDDLCIALLQKPSNSGHEDGVVAVLRDYMQNNAFDEVFVDKYGSITGCIHGSRPGPKLLFDGHIDTVPVPDPSVWKHKPYGGERENGRIYGRGASDMKGAVAAMCVGAAKFARGNARNFAGSVYVAGVVHEECFEGIAAREISARVQPDVVIIGEASELNLKIGQRGRAEVVLETFGVPAHSASPHKGVNAVHAMMRLVAEVERFVPAQHPVLGPGVAVLTDIISTPYPGASVVPSHCRATYDRRLLMGEKPDTVLAPFAGAIRTLAARDATFKAQAAFARGKEQCHTGNTIEGERFFPGWLFDEREPFIQHSLQGLAAAGFKPAISHYSFCTNGSHYAGEKGIRTFGFGPSLETLAHTIDEYIEEAQLHGAAQGYAVICQSLLEGNGAL